MKELLYLEVPTADAPGVLAWLQQTFVVPSGVKVSAPTGFRWQPAIDSDGDAVVGCLWSLQRTTYLKLFRWGDQPQPGEAALVRSLQQQILAQFPPSYPAPPEIDLTKSNIFEALADRYPQTVKYFQRMPNGERDLLRAYWWERRWRASVRNPQAPKQVVFPAQGATQETGEIAYDLIYVGGALGVIHAAMMAQLGYRVLLLERLPFGRMNREWNISREELQVPIDLGLFTPEEVEGLIATEYRDGFHKFFDANNPSQARSNVLHTPTVLNVAIAADKIIQLCGQKLREAGGDIWDETEFQRADVAGDRVTVTARHLPTDDQRQVAGRLLIDAMGTASPIAWQLNGIRAFDSVCPTVGAVIAEGIDFPVWDLDYGDVLFSHGDISRGRQLIWELFPAGGKAVTVYLFHYHQVNPENPGSLLEMYEDFFSILPEYRRCEMDALVWEKATFGYIPGHFSQSESDRRVSFDRLLALGDAASLQSPLVFTGFGSMIRNLGRLTDLLDTALQHDLLSEQHLSTIRAYQSNVAVTWMFSKGMMVPTGRVLPPQRVNSMLNTFFGLLATESPEVADNFIKDRFDWWLFNRLALKAAIQNPLLLWWIWDSAGPWDLLRWLGSYVTFTLATLVAWALGWLPAIARSIQPWLEQRAPGLWLQVLARSYAIDLTLGRRARVARAVPPRSPVAPVATVAGDRETAPT
ncbi:MAG: flavin-dependent dehydrogenase [Oscillatoriales cyanobacterium]|nr:MAG: flavin-dependent dehydrogenase [Oscillatoriales cyanobacterium]